MTKAERARAIGCWYGQLVGDALGSLVSGDTAAEIAKAYPKGVRELHDGGAFDTLAGQPTAGSELALSLSWSLLDEADYEEESAASHYVRWLESEPFGEEDAALSALRAGQQASEQDAPVAPAMRAAADAGVTDPGPLLRVSPIALFGASRGEEWVARAATQDAALTHAHPAVQQANAIFAATLTRAIRGETDPRALLIAAQQQAALLDAHALVRDALREAEQGQPADIGALPGVGHALQSAFHALLSGASFEDALANTVGRGGASHSHAIVVGALLGAVHGANAIPLHLRECVDACEPDEDEDDVSHPRPSWLWPTGAEGLALSLREAGEAAG